MDIFEIVPPPRGSQVPIFCVMWRAAAGGPDDAEASNSEFALIKRYNGE